MEVTLLEAAWTAFLGGIVLNIMPCVLPVLTMKVFHVIDTGQEDRASIRRHGLAYTAGVMVAFIVFSSVVVALKVAGQQVGWGMQFQNPAFVASICTLMVILGLNALGVFELTISMGSASGEGYGASFGNGVVAAIMATPCSAPFLGVGATYALSANTLWWETLVVFEIIGFGLAFPFLLISYVPAAAKLLPRPGAWMETFKHVMGFTLLGAAVWLFGVLLKQVTPDSAFWFLGFLLAVGVGLWAIQRFGGLMYGTLRRIGVRAAVLSALVAAGTVMVDFERAEAVQVEQAADEPPVKDGRINWASFDPIRVQLAQRRGRPVFMDYTADWCVNCKANERVVLETDTVRGALTDTGVLPMKADWTNDDETIGEWLEKLGRSGIPAYAIYLPDGSVDLLPETITPGLVAERLKAAAEKYPVERYLPVEQACLAQADSTRQPIASNE